MQDRKNTDRKWSLNKMWTIQNFSFQEKKLTKNLILNQIGVSLYISISIMFIIRIIECKAEIFSLNGDTV